VSATDFHRFLAPLILGLSAALVAGSPAQSQISPVVTEADIERARRETPTVTEQDIELARQKYALPSDAGHRSAPPNSPKIEALPQPATRVRSTWKRWLAAMPGNPMRWLRPRGSLPGQDFSSSSA
jgi:conjugal transfer pilus assembly protein TrbC